jgi:hypothetical protein
MKRIALLTLLSLLLSSLTWASCPVRWTQWVPLKKLSDVNVFLTKTYPKVPYYDSQQKRNIMVKTCSDYFNAQSHNYGPVNNIAIGQARQFKINCDAMRYLEFSQPSPYCRLKNFNVMKHFRNLPAAVVFPGYVSDPKGTLRAAYPDTKIKQGQDRNSATTVMLISKKADMEAVVKVLAFGDFDHSGKDQALLYVASYSLSGSFHTFNIVALSYSQGRFVDASLK